MRAYEIGKVVSVSGEKLIISLAPLSVDGKKGVSEAMLVSITSPTGPENVLIGQPGSFISVQIPGSELLCLVAGIDMKESILSTTEQRNADALHEYPVDACSRELTCIPIGTIDTEGKFERGSDVLPTVNALAYAVTAGTIDKIYAGYADGDFAIGKLSLVPDQDAKINLDALLSRHAAILGQTGGGKSWTVASILQAIAKFPHATTILLDHHGEYENAFEETYADTISVDELEFPYWLMNCEELIGLMVDRSEAAAPNQVAKFKELLQFAKESHSENRSLGISKITVDTPVYFDFSSILRKFEELDIQMVTGSQGKLVKGSLNGQFTRLLMRAHSRLNDRRYDLIFKPQTYNSSASMENLFRRLLGKVQDSTKKVVVLDLSPIPFDVRNSVISLILRCLFDFGYWYKRIHNEPFPMAIFCDEAHVYLNDRDITASASRYSAERIAKEGRKYGISLTVISQRPHEVSATILSQCGSFLCLRTTNPDDQSYIKNLLPDNIRGVVSIFQTLRRGECILLGDAVLMPTRIRITKPDPKPSSNDASFTKTWAQDSSDLDVARVLDSWRKQSVTDH